MILHEHKRVKHGHLPGDVSHRTLVLMREWHFNIVVSPWQTFGRNCVRSFNKVIHQKGRAVQRRRDKREIARQLEEME